MDAVNPAQEFANPATPAAGSSGANPDLMKVLIRWKWLPVLGAILGLTIGYLIYSQMPPEYRAIARVQVVKPGKEFPMVPFETHSEQRSNTDELVVIQSSVVLRNAVEKGRLAQNRYLQGMSEEQIVAWLKKPKVVEVRLGTKELTSDILDIGVTTDNAELSGDIAEAIVAGYEDFVSRKYKTYTQEAIGTLSKFSDDYDKRRSKVKDELEKMKAKSNLIWLNGAPHDPASERVLQVNHEILELDNKIRNYQSVLKQVDDAVAAKRSGEECLRMIAKATGDHSSRSDAGPASMHWSRIREIYRSVESFEENQVLPARTNLSNIQQQGLGESHRSVESARRRLAQLEEELEIRKNRAKATVDEMESDEGLNTKGLSAIEVQLQVATGALQEELQKLEIEKQKCNDEIRALQPIVQENQAFLATFQFALKDLESITTIAHELSESLRKMTLGTEYGQKTVNRLDLATIGTLVGPSMVKYLGLGMIGGLVLFCGLAYLLELADRSYRNPDEIVSDLGSPIIGHLPLAATTTRTDRINDKIDASLVTFHKSRSSVSEAFRGIRTALFFGSQHGAIKVIQVTSPVPGDGKSTVASNLAVSISQSGRRVCLIDCDLRRPRIGKLFGIREDVGLVQVINGKAELDDAIQQTPIDNLSVISCGRRPGNPSELLSSEMFAETLNQLRKRFDFIIVDTPPMLVVSDPAIVSSQVDGVILTIRLRRNLKPIATRAAQMLHSINATVLGVVVNGIGGTAGGYGYGGYRYDNYQSRRSGGYGASGYGGYGYGSTYQYGGYYGGSLQGREYYDDQVPANPSRSSQDATR